MGNVLITVGSTIVHVHCFLSLQMGGKSRERERDLEECEPNEILCKNFQSVNWHSVVDLDECTPID